MQYEPVKICRFKKIGFKQLFIIMLIVKYLRVPVNIANTIVGYETELIVQLHLAISFYTIVFLGILYTTSLDCYQPRYRQQYTPTCICSNFSKTTPIYFNATGETTEMSNPSP